MKLKSLIKPEYAFAVLAIFFGLLWVFCTKPMSTNDQGYHLSQSYMMFVAQDETPVDIRIIAPEIDNAINTGDDGFFNDSLNLENPGFALNWDSAKTCWREWEGDDGVWGSGRKAYSCQVGIKDIGHLPQGVAMLIVRSINPAPSFNQLYYPACIMNLLVSTLIIFFAIRIIRKCKWVLFMVGLIPTIVMQTRGLIYDPMTNAVCLLFFAMIFNLYIQKHTATRKQLLGLLGATVLAVLTKQTNILLLIFVLFVPSVVWRDLWLFRQIRSLSARIKSDKRFLIKCAIWLIFLAGVAYIANDLLTKLAADAQLGKIDYVKQMIKTLYHSIFRNDVASAITAKQPWYQVNQVTNAVLAIPVIWIEVIFILILGLIFMKSSEELNKDKIGRMAIVSISIFVIVCLIVWVGMVHAMGAHDTLQRSVILGVQGRYFTPYIVLLFPIVAWLKPTVGRLSQKWLPALCVCSAVVINLFCLFGNKL